MAVGIIAEYNPFHNGHLYHLNKVKEMFPNEEIILILSGNFTQRGEPAIINKWKKTEIAIKAGIDLVIELEKYNIYISNHSACSSEKNISLAVYALTNDEERAKSSIRISLSHLTTIAEIDELIKKIKELV